MASTDRDINEAPDFIDKIDRLFYGALPGSGRLAATLLALLLLLWPICSFAAMFIFDAPIKSPLDEFFRFVLAFSVWLYPLLYLIGLGLARWAARHTPDTCRVLLPFAIPAFTPCLVFLTYAFHN